MPYASVCSNTHKCQGRVVSGITVYTWASKTKEKKDEEEEKGSLTVFPLDRSAKQHLEEAT